MTLIQTETPSQEASLQNDADAMVLRTTVRKNPKYKTVVDFFARAGKLDVLQSFEDIWVETALELSREENE